MIEEFTLPEAFEYIDQITKPNSFINAYTKFYLMQEIFTRKQK